MAGKRNIWSGFFFLGLFMLYGFALVYLRDFAPGKEQWIASYGSGTHFESRLAHAHGNLFALIDIAVGVVLIRLPIPPRTASVISWIAIAGMLMPIGIFAEVAMGASPVFVLIGGALGGLARRRACLRHGRRVRSIRRSRSPGRTLWNTHVVGDGRSFVILDRHHGDRVFNRRLLAATFPGYLKRFNLEESAWTTNALSSASRWDWARMRLA